MTDEECDEILRTIATVRDEDVHELARARLERLRASMPPSREPKLDTVPLANIEAMITEAIAAERERTGEILAELIAAERHDTEAFLSGATTAFRADLASLQNSLVELREILANEAKRGSATVFDLPRLPLLRRDLN